MILLPYFILFAPLTAVYLLFLARMRQGLRALAAQDAVLVADDALPSLTVIVPARDEAARIGACVASLAAQDYPAGRLEILIVDDHSRDGTADAARTAAAGLPIVRVVPLTDGAGKKAAITAGVAVARGAAVVTTDADCAHDPRWLRAMAAPLAAGSDIVAGPVVVGDRSSLRRRLEALDFLGLVGVGAGFFGIGWPRLCNGANLAYRRARFLEADGYAGNDGIASGDDEFLLQRLVYRHGARATFAASPEAVVRTSAAATVGELLAQRARWASKGLHYEDRRFTLFLGLLFVYLLFCCALPVAMLWSPAACAAALVFFLAKLWGDVSVLTAAARLFRQPLRAADILLAELLHPFYLVAVSLRGVTGIAAWKGRPIRRRNR